jgi:hypothetical protein
MRDHFVTLRNAVRLGRVHLTAGLAAAALCGGLLTQAEAAGGSGTPTTWGGLNWGIGIAADFDVGGTRVASAITSPPNNTVRLENTSSNVGISFVLESHYFFPGPTGMGRAFGSFEPPGGCTTMYPGDSNCTEWAHGPFVAIEIGGGATAPTSNTTGPITAYALGWMVGFHHPKYDATPSHTLVTDNTSWNIGLGLRVDPSAKVLGDGLVANQPLPAGDIIRYKTEPRLGVMLMSSFSF